MHEFIETADDVFAVKISSKITSADLDALIDRLEAVMARHEKVHVFMESHSIEGIEISQLSQYLSRSMPFFGKLKQFGRIAVVADQTWIRVWTRIESALLPFVSYKVFTPDQRDRALAWVEGKGTL
jgi:hypothetical protein